MFFRLHLYTCYIKFFFKVIFPFVGLLSEGQLDFKFLSDRFRRGKDEVNKLLDAKHKLNTYSSLVMAHPDIVSIQAEMGTTGCLNCVFWSFGSPYPLSFYCPYPSFCYSLTTSNSDLRLTIMLMDTTVWPSRAWSEGSLCLKHIFMFGSYLSITLRCAEHRWGGLCHAIGVLRK